MRLQIQQTQIDAIALIQTNFGTKHAEYLNPSTRTRLVDIQIQTLYIDGKGEQSGIQQQIKNNPNFTLTDEDYAKLFIHKDATTRTLAMKF